MAKTSDKSETKATPETPTTPATMRVRANRCVRVKGVGTKKAGEEFDCPADQRRAFGPHLTDVRTREDVPAQTR